MAFVPPSARVRERILSVGGAGMGKSHDFYCIARKHVVTNTDAIFYVIDTDVSVDRHLVLDFPEVDAAGVVVDFQVSTWDELLRALTTVQGQMRRQDWLMIDLLSPTWDWVQRWYTEQVFHKSRSEYMMHMRQGMASTDKNAKVFDGWKDWPFITGVYMEDLMTPLIRLEGNIYCTSEQKKYSDENVEADTKAMFSGYGILPVGQKRTPHSFKTTLWKRQFAGDEWSVTSIRDTGRRLLEMAPVVDFAEDYLVNVANWKDSEEEARLEAEKVERKRKADEMRARIAAAKVTTDPQTEQEIGQSK